MSGPAETYQGPGPGPIREGAVARLLRELGFKEEDGKNWGSFIRRLAGYFLSPERLATFAPGQKRAGRLQWCALAVCGMVYEELVARGHKELAAQWRRIASMSCGEFWENLDALGFAWRPGRPLPAALCPQGASVPGLPGLGDFVFYGVEKDGELDFSHVDFYLEATPGGFDTVGGNSGATCDSVARSERVDGQSKVLGFARLPW